MPKDFHFDFFLLQICPFLHFINDLIQSDSTIININKYSIWISIWILFVQFLLDIDDK